MRVEQSGSPAILTLPNELLQDVVVQLPPSAVYQALTVNRRFAALVCEPPFIRRYVRSRCPAHLTGALAPPLDTTMQRRTALRQIARDEYLGVRPSTWPLLGCLRFAEGDLRAGRSNWPGRQFVFVHSLRQDGNLRDITVQLPAELGYDAMCWARFNFEPEVVPGTPELALYGFKGELVALGQTRSEILIFRVPPCDRARHLPRDNPHIDLTACLRFARSERGIAPLRWDGEIKAVLLWHGDAASLWQAAKR